VLRTMTTVPTLVGLELLDAHALAFAARVTVVSAQPDGVLPDSGVVSTQEPPPGTPVWAASPVKVTVARGRPSWDLKPEPVLASSA
jgi:beta-lactam-binding protein with PASTA domain